MSIPTLDDVLRAVRDFEAALEAEQAARAAREEKAEALMEALAQFRGTITAQDVTDLSARLSDHAAKLEDIARSSP